MCDLNHEYFLLFFILDKAFHWSPFFAHALPLLLNLFFRWEEFDSCKVSLQFIQGVCKVYGPQETFAFLLVLIYYFILGLSKISVFAYSFKMIFFSTFRNNRQKSRTLLKPFTSMVLNENMFWPSCRPLKWFVFFKFSYTRFLALIHQKNTTFWTLWSCNFGWSCIPDQINQHLHFSTFDCK